MLGSLRSGLFLAVLAVAAGQFQALGRVLADCDTSLQGCNVDERKDELTGLDLLQMQIRLQSNPAQMVPAAVHADAQLVVTKPQVSAKAANHKTEVHTSDSQQESASPSVKTAASQALGEHAHKLAVLVSGSAGQTLCCVVFIIIILCVCLGYSRQSLQQSSQEVDQKPTPQGSPSAQQLLQTPPSCHSVGPFQIVASRNSSLATPGSSRHSPLVSPAQSLRGSTTLPPACPSLILPHTEARFMISIDSLLMPAGELDRQTQQFDILGTSGRKLLHCTVSKTPDGRRSLALASCGCDEDPRVTLLAPPRYDQQSGPIGSVSRVMELYGKSGTFYGTLEPVSKAGALLRCDGELVMSLEIGSGDFCMSAASMDGQLLASAGKNVTQDRSVRFESNDMWKLQVKPNFDAVLIAACMLGTLIFK